MGSSFFRRACLNPFFLTIIALLVGAVLVGVEWIKDHALYNVILFGFTWAITKEYVGEPIRMLVSKLGSKFKYLIHCPVCFGFWVGMVPSIVLYFTKYDLGIVRIDSIWVAIGYGFLNMIIAHFMVQLDEIVDVNIVAAEQALNGEIDLQQQSPKTTKGCCGKNKNKENKEQ